MRVIDDLSVAVQTGDFQIAVTDGDRFIFGANTLYVGTTSDGVTGVLPANAFDAAFDTRDLG